MQWSATRTARCCGEADRYLLSAKNVGGMKVLTATLTDAGADALRKIGDFLRDKEENVVAVLSQRQRREDHLPGRLRQGRREGRHQGGRHHQECH